MLRTASRSSIRSSKHKIDRPFSVLLSQRQRSGVLCRFCCQDRLRSRYSIKCLALPVNQREEAMQGSTPFHFPLTEYPLLSPQVSDTARPVQTIPVHYFHSLQQPFCRDATCKCHWRQQEVTRLLESVLEGNLTLREAAN